MTVPGGLLHRRPHRGGDATLLALPRSREARGPAGTGPVERVQDALRDIAAGRPVVLLDDEDGGDGGDLVVAAELVTPAVMAFLVRHTAGFVCVALTEDDADRLDLPLLVRADADSRGGAQCVAVDAGSGGTTGISAADRAATVRLLAGAATAATDLVRPGHVVPLRVRAGGVFGRRGRAEAAVDLAVLAGLRPAGALCRLVSSTDPGELARGPELADFARAHGLSLVSIGDLVAYRLQVDTLVDRRVSAALPLAAGRFTAVGYSGRVDGREHVALVHGDIGDGEEVSVYVHRECVLGDALGSARCGCGARLQSALTGVADAGRGVVVYLRDGGRVGCGLMDVPTRRPCADHPPVAGHDAPGDDALGALGALGAQILRDLGVRSARPLSGGITGRRGAPRTA